MTESQYAEDESDPLQIQASIDEEELRKAKRATDAGYASFEEYSKAQHRNFAGKRVVRQKQAQEYRDQAEKNGRDLDGEKRERERARQQEGEQSEPRHRPEKCHCVEHLSANFCKGNLKSPEGSMNSVSDLFLEQMRPRLEDVVIDERSPSKRFNDRTLQRVWSHDSEDEQFGFPLPYWADRDPVLQHILAQESLAKLGSQREPNMTEKNEIDNSADSDGGEGRVEFDRHKAGGTGTKQLIGKRSTKERKENGDMEDWNTDVRRVKARIDEPQHNTYRHIPQVRGSAKRSRAHIPPATYLHQLPTSEAQDSSKAMAATSMELLPQTPLMDSANESARTAAPANHLTRLRDTLAAERMDEEVRAPFPLAGTGVQTVDVIAPSAHGSGNIGTSALSVSGHLKRNRDAVTSEDDDSEDRTPKRVKGTSMRRSYQQHLPTNMYRLPRVHARHTGYTRILQQPQVTGPADVRVTCPQPYSPHAARLQPAANHRSLRSQNNNAPTSSQDTIDSVPEDAEVQNRALEANNTRPHTRQRLGAIQYEESRGSPIERELQDDGRKLPSAGSLKRGRGSRMEDDEDDLAGPSASPSKRLRQMEIPDSENAVLITGAGTAASPLEIHDPVMEASTNAGESINALVMDGIAANVTAKPHTETVAEPGTHGTKRSRGVQKGTARKNSAAGVQSKARKGGPSKIQSGAKSKTATVTSRWLKSLLENGRQTRSQKRKVFVELDARSQVNPVQRRPCHFKAVMIPATRSSSSGTN
ncbi:MAG: hypothetical protein Q9169_004225 [Polycauliona sp. 2 TL-2023]